MVVGYGVMMAISLVLIAVYYTAIKKREFWLGLLFVCVALVNTGYFMLSLSKTVQFALFANDMAYLGSVFLMMCMLFTIVKLCGYNVKKRAGYCADNNRRCYVLYHCNKRLVALVL